VTAVLPTTGPAAPNTAAVSATAAGASRLPALPALVVGQVAHNRPAPIRHAFRHRTYLWLIDLDAVPLQPWYLRAFARFSAADHLGDPGSTIRDNVQNYLDVNGVRLGSGGRILMLANARVMGHVFDPLTVFWCYDASGALVCAVAEVHNTYGERHAYLLRPDESGIAATDKALYVSPFFDVSGTYEVRLTLRPDVVATSVTLRRHGAVAFTATFRGRPEPATRRALVARLLRHPLMPQRISALIRAHGAWLWMHGLTTRSRPHHPRQEGV